MRQQQLQAEDGQGTLRFYASIKLKDALTIVFFAMITFALSFAAVVKPSSTSFLLPLAAVTLLSGGVWLEWRRGWPQFWHGPACELNATGIVFWPRRKHRQFLPWDDLDSVGYDMSDNSMVFHTKRPQTYDRRYLLFLKRPPFVATGLQSPQGEYLANVLHHYWDEDTKIAVNRQ